MKESIKYIESMYKEFYTIEKLKKATKYISNKLTIKITRIGKISKIDTRYEFKVTVGVPNYEERQFMKLLKKSGEKYPIRKVQFKYYK